ncbi:hydrogenase-2 operon protein HybE [Actinobacillus porcinus]|uniref:Hydrogenase-2 operon protein HybE n=1 Tax=Actinobacillus porcinus TaxID=51048 RepID=A0ABY6TIJ4_9PAST|nr:hydrogenase-2 assembly chaperone [Actinobacillus porcinus]VFY92743.1 hydrogenase-2 operon protein HybE [Actinobacillus porcinus]VTU07211.1 hydrogenase-2 operon protein HybE [Actinobacillus porcinus]
MYRYPETESEKNALSVISGFIDNPSELFRSEMEKIAENMRDLPFYRHDIPCFTPNFVLFEGQWIGTVLTPWMMSIVVLPGPQQQWEERAIGDKLGLQLPYKTITFTVSGVESVPQYLSSSLLSPLDPNLTAEQAIQLTKDCLTMLLSLPVQQQAPDLNKRNILRAMLK